MLSPLHVCAAIPSIVAFDKNSLKVIFHFERDANTPSTVKITLNAINSCSSPMTDFLFQAAVPKVTICIHIINTHCGGCRVSRCSYCHHQEVLLILGQALTRPL